MDWNTISILIQIGLLAAIILFLYVRTKKEKQPERTVKPRQNLHEIQQLARMRASSLNEPLSEKIRPTRFDDIVGQQDGIKALQAALCGPNPQHVLIFGPPGVGKTCAARLVLEEAKKHPDSPFNDQSKFIELDATCVRFDERAIADPLIGSVHDPIYQGAGALGSQGVPQPKPGAVTRAHCGVLFLDEIGELHPMQMNKLLKVLEDRKVFFESAYYSADNGSIPPYIHDIFQNGLPADFRLVGATTRRPEELPQALRSRCVEIFFRPLNQQELEQVAYKAVRRAAFTIDKEALYRAALYSRSGRDAVNLMQLACGIAYGAKRKHVERADVEWVVRTCNYMPRMEQRLSGKPRVGVANGLAVAGTGQGVVLEIECIARKKDAGGSLTLNGLVAEEEFNLKDRKLKRKSTAYGSAEIVMTAFEKYFRHDCNRYEVQFNIPGGTPVDGPSAGVAIAIALMSAITGQAPDPLLASTGEITMNGEVRPVGGVRDKVNAAISAGAKCILVPRSNWEEDFAHMEVQIKPIDTLRDAMRAAFLQEKAPGLETDAAAVSAAPAMPGETVGSESLLQRICQL